MSFETKCLLKAFQFHYCPDNDAKSMVKHFNFLQKVSVSIDTRPDTRLPQSRPGGQGLYLRSPYHLGGSNEA